MTTLAPEAWRRIVDRAQTLLNAEGLELVDLEFRREGRGWVLRLFMDKPGGITLDDCAAVSREWGDQLDVEDLIPFRYTLEVSSPGLDRPLKKDADFLRHIGKTIQLTTTTPVAGQGFFKGRLLDYQPAGRLLLADRKNIWEIPTTLIAKARLVFEG